MSIDFNKIRTENPLLEAISRYVELVSRGGEYVGLCPFHSDSKPTLTVYNSSDGLLRYRCFACGAGSEGGDVIDFIAAIENISTAEACKMLSGGKLPDIGTFKPPPPPPDASNVWNAMVPVPKDAPEYNPSKTFNPKRNKVVMYRPSRLDEYRGSRGDLLCYVVRLDFDDGGKACMTICYCSGPNGAKLWAAKRMKPPFPLQGLDSLAKRPKAHVLMVSGEKCKSYAGKHLTNFVAVSWLGGDQTVGSIAIGPLLGRHITYCPDNDKTGKESMIAIENRILQARAKT